MTDYVSTITGISSGSGGSGLTLSAGTGSQTPAFAVYCPPTSGVELRGEKHMDLISLGFSAILFALALAIVVGTRIVWLQNIGHATYTPVKKPKK